MALSKTTKDHDEIRSWAEERGAKPSHVKATESKGDIGILRLDFPGYSGADSLEEISWDDFFEKFDERNLALVFQEQTAEGERSNFNKIISGDSVDTDDEDSGGEGDKKTRPATKKSSSRGGKKSAPAAKSSGTATKKSAAPAKKSASKQVPAKKSASKQSASAKKAAPAKKTAAKVPAKKVPAKKVAAKKTTTKGASKSSPAKKTVGKKVAAKKTTAKSARGRR